jgi:hypothetical protein
MGGPGKERRHGTRTEEAKDPGQARVGLEESESRAQARDGPREALTKGAGPSGAGAPAFEADPNGASCGRSAWTGGSCARSTSVRREPSARPCVWSCASCSCGRQRDAPSYVPSTCARSICGSSSVAPPSARRYAASCAAISWRGPAPTACPCRPPRPRPRPTLAFPHPASISRARHPPRSNRVVVSRCIARSWFACKVTSQAPGPAARRPRSRADGLDD